MKWVLAVFGRAGSPFIADEVEKYVKRLRTSAMPLEVVELKESKIEVYRLLSTSYYLFSFSKYEG